MSGKEGNERMKERDRMREREREKEKEKEDRHRKDRSKKLTDRNEIGLLTKGRNRLTSHPAQRTHTGECV